jgi:hypothetical protein
VGSVGAQQAKEIQKDYALGNISLDDIYNIISNLAASPGGTFALSKFKEEKDKSKKEVKKKEDKGKKPEDPDPIKPSDLTPFTPKKEDIEKSTPLQILSGTNFIANVKKLVTKDRTKIPDILEFLDKGAKRDIFNDNDYKAMLKEGVEEINYQLGQEVTGVGWYDDGVKRAMEIAEKINPKFGTDPNLKDLVIFTTAISSSGVKVGTDFKAALQIVDIFADTGQIPLKNPNTNAGWTQRGTNLAKQLNLANNYIQANGLDSFLEFLHTPITGRELNEFRKEYGNLGPSKGVNVDVTYTGGHRAFGPKIGEFMANLYGTDDNNVTDMWNIRGMNRLIGGNMYMRDTDGKIMTDKDGKILENTGTPTVKMKTKFDQFMTDLSTLVGKTVRDTQAIKWYFEQGLYTKLGVKSVPKDYGTAAQEVLDQKLKAESDAELRQGETSNIEITPPVKKFKGGYVTPVPEVQTL